MTCIAALWTVWVVVGVILLGLILYRTHLGQRHGVDPLARHVSPETHGDATHHLKRLRPAIRIFGGIEGLTTLGIVAFYVLDALREF
jgi:hypothetical protein